jgi:hypothetical protein
MLSASTTRALSRVSAMDQPTTRRLNVSSTTARYSQPLQVRT